VTEDQFTILFEKEHFNIPNILLPKGVHNEGNYIISLGNLCEWMGQKAESMGVDILPSIAGDQIIYKQDGSVGGVITGDFGIAKDGSEKSTYSPGIEIRAKQTIFTEGCRGSLTERIKKNFNLEKNNISTQHYGIGLKEVWRVAEGNPYFKAGRVHHTVNWPLQTNMYGGSFLYHMNPNLIHLGLVVGLDYKNPYTNPYELFQQYKTHP
jgi:electron-transferring-flavoprotein dehydrogenase